MEYVEGVPIDRYCQENQIPLKERLTLFLDVCEAIQVVHRHSTIHRDIKPGNILVTDDGQAKLVDFGISRVLDLGDDDIEHTAAGLELMTPKYASPEQLRREILSTATDIYSLGAVLNKVLTGLAPFSKDNPHDLKQAVINEDPTRPSDLLLRSETTESVRARQRLSRHLKGDLDTIVLMALRKEPERRYASVEKFADDIRNYLAGKPVSAQPDTLGYRTRKFVNRNVAAVGVAALLLVVLIGATVVSLTLYNQAESSRQEAVLERRVASRERNAAVSTSEFLQELLASVSPATIDGRLDITVREILDEASERLENDLSDQPEVAAALHFVVGRSYANLAEFESGENHLWESIALRRDLTPPDEEGILRSMVAIGHIYEDKGAYAEAESLLIGVIPADLALVDPVILSELETILARIYAYLSRLEDAETYARRAVLTAEAIPDSAHVMHAQAQSELGNSLYRLGRYEEAEHEYQEAITTAHRTIGTGHTVTGQCYNNHALALGALGRYEEAITQLLAALEIFEATLPGNHPEFATTHMNLADNYFMTEQYDLAIQTYSLTREELIETHGDDHVLISLSYNGLGNCYLKAGKLEEGRDAFVEAIRRMDAALGETHPWVATPRNNLGRIYRDLGDSVEAERLAWESLGIMRASLPEGHYYLSRPLGLLTRLKMDEGDYQAALVFAEEAAEICIASLDEDNPDRVGAEERLEKCQRELEGG